MLLSLMGCSLFKPAPPPVDSYKLLPPSEGPTATLLKQRVSLTIKGQEKQFLIISRLEAKRILLVALLPTGQKLLTLEYDGSRLQQENLSGVDIPAKDILAIMQFSLWPEAVIKDYYAASEGWVTHLSDQQRELWHSSGPVLSIKFQAQGISVDNFLHGYQVAIQTLEEVAL